jgi:hypothetical protein
MKVGDLVIIGGWNDCIGIIIRCIAGTSKAKVVEWMDGTRCSYPEKVLEVYNENR